jgi:hypothetical protein
MLQTNTNPSWLTVNHVLQSCTYLGLPTRMPLVLNLVSPGMVTKLVIALVLQNECKAKG